MTFSKGIPFVSKAMVNTNYIMTNEKLAELWLTQTRSTAKTGNMFFRDNLIFSYGEHFLIGKIVGETVHLNTDKYSSSTSRQQTIVREAVREAGFHIRYCDNLKAC